MHHHGLFCWQQRHFISAAAVEAGAGAAEAVAVTRAQLKPCTAFIIRPEMKSQELQQQQQQQPPQASVKKGEFFSASNSKFLSVWISQALVSKLPTVLPE